MAIAVNIQRSFRELGKFVGFNEVVSVRSIPNVENVGFKARTDLNGSMTPGTDVKTAFWVQSELSTTPGRHAGPQDDPTLATDVVGRRTIHTAPKLFLMCLLFLSPLADVTFLSSGWSQ